MSINGGVGGMTTWRSAPPQQWSRAFSSWVPPVTVPIDFNGFELHVPTYSGNPVVSWDAGAVYTSPRGDTGPSIQEIFRRKNYRKIYLGVVEISASPAIAHRCRAGTVRLCNFGSVIAHNMHVPQRRDTLIPLRRRQN